MVWLRRIIFVPASETQMGLVLALCIFTMSVMSIALVWQAQVIAKQNAVIHMLETRFGGSPPSPGPYTQGIRRTRRKKGEPDGSPFFAFFAASPFAYLWCGLLSGDSHRVRGVFSFVSLLSPVESFALSGAQRAHSFVLRSSPVQCN